MQKGIETEMVRYEIYTRENNYAQMRFRTMTRSKFTAKVIAWFFYIMGHDVHVEEQKDWSWYG